MIPVAISAIENDYEREFMRNLYDKFYRIAEARAYAILHSHEDAEEAVQDSFIKLIDKLPKIIKLGNEKLAAYVIITVKNTAIDSFRKGTMKSTENFLLMKMK